MGPGVQAGVRGAGGGEGQGAEELGLGVIGSD